jgi:hypothetical protein
MSEPTNLSYDIGDGVPIDYIIAQAATVVLTVTDPDSATSTPPVTPSGTGPVTYTAVVAATKAGIWKYEFVATGGVSDAESGTFTVRRPVDTHVYCTIAQILEQVDADPADLPEPLLRRAVLATTKAIDKTCGRRFWADQAPVARLYRPRDPEMVFVHDIATRTGLQVATDDTGAGSFSTVWDPADYQLEPLGADQDGEPWWVIAAVGNRRFPMDRRRARLQVTARFGWPQIPDDVEEAAILKATKLFKRRESPDGFATGGLADFGPVRISRYEDPDAWAALHNLIRLSIPET